MSTSFQPSIHSIDGQSMARCSTDKVFCPVSHQSVSWTCYLLTKALRYVRNRVPNKEMFESNSRSVRDNIRYIVVRYKMLPILFVSYSY